MAEFIQKHKKLITVIFLLLVLSVVVPVLVGSAYTYMCEDDFSFEAGANDVAKEHNSGLVGGLIRAYEFYNWHQGTYLFNAAIHLLRVYTRWQLPGFHLFMILINLVFALSLWYLLDSMFEDKMVSMIIMFVSVWAIYQSRGTLFDKELFYWYTGALNFTLGLTCSFFALGMLLKYMRKRYSGNGLKLLIPSAILAFLGSGVALEITAPNCAFMLAAVILGFTCFKNDKKVIIPFVAALAGAILNVVAPGNYKRADAEIVEGHETVFDAIRDTFECYGKETHKIFESPVFWGLLVFTFFICVWLGVRLISENMNLGLLAFTFLGSFLVQYFTMFPVCFGYHSTSLMEMRTTAAYEMIARLMYIFAVICLAQFFTDNKIGVIRPVAIALLVLTAVLGVVFGDVKEDLKSGFSYQTAHDFMNGSMQEAYKTRAYVLHSLELATEGTDVFISVPLRAHSEAAYGMGLLNDREAFVNRSAAGLYHVNSIVVDYTD